MSRTLQQRISDYLAKEGTTGRSKLSLAVERGTQMIDRYEKGLSRPSPKIGYKLALACGCSKEEAEMIRNELSSKRAMDAA